MHFLCSSFTAIQDPAKKLKQHHNFPIFFRGSAAKNCRKMLLLGLEHSSLRDAAQQFYLSCQDNVFRRECTNYSPLKKPMKYPQYSKITQNVSFWSVSERRNSLVMPILPTRLLRQTSPGLQTVTPSTGLVQLLMSDRNLEIFKHCAISKKCLILSEKCCCCCFFCPTRFVPLRKLRTCLIEVSGCHKFKSYSYGKTQVNCLKRKEMFWDERRLLS